MALVLVFVLVLVLVFVFVFMSVFVFVLVLVAGEFVACGGSRCGICANYTIGVREKFAYCECSDWL